MDLFSPDSKFMRAMGRLGDLMLLNLLFLLCSLPVVTLGAACTALYTVCFRFDTAREGGVLRAFFLAFRQNFRQATALWLLLLLGIAAAALDVWLFLAFAGALRFLCVLFGLLLLLALLAAVMAFPLQSQFQNSVWGTLKNAMSLSLGYLPRSGLLLVLWLFPLGLVFKDLYVFLYTGFLWVALYFSAVAYLGTRLLKAVFAPYREEEDA